MQDAERQRIDARKAGVLPPAERGIGIAQRAGLRMNVVFAQFAEVIGFDQVANEGLAGQAKRTGHDLRHPAGVFPRGLQHPMRLGRIQAHSGFSENMFSGSQRRQRNWAMQIRPGADDDRVDRGIGHQIFPFRELPLDAKLCATRSVESGRRLHTATISTSGSARKPGMCFVRRVFAGADNADAQLRGHGHPGRIA